MIIREALKSLGKSKTFFIVIILQLVVTSVICNLVIDRISSMNKSYYKLQQNSEKSYFWITENLFDNELEHRFFNSENSMQRLKAYYTEMADSKDYKYLEICNQEITIKNTNSDKEEYIPAANFSVNLDCLNEFGIKTIEGRLFTEEEMSIDLSTKTLPILLGYNLRNKHKIGDVFEGTYLLRKSNYKVIGVLEKNSHIIKTNIQEQDVGEFYYQYFDYSYVTPLVNCEEEPGNKEEKFFEKILYMFKLNATVAAPAGFNAGEIKAKMDALADKYDMYDFQLIWMSNDKLNLLKLVSKDSIDIMVILAGVLFVFSLISLFAILSAKINKNIGHYAVHLMLGASKKKIAIYIITEILLILILSHGLSFMITRAVFSTRILYSMLWIGLSLTAFLGACIYPVLRLMKKEIDVLLLGDLYE